MTHQEAAAWLLDHDGYLILTHVRPDGDTLGCAAGLCAALRSRGKTAYVLPNPETTRTYLDYVEAYHAPEDYEPETVISVDVAALGLMPQAAAPYIGRIALAIDHHPSQEFFAGETCLDADRAACGELVYDICVDMGAMSAEAARPLYVAVSTDCGCFAYGNTRPDTHRVAAALMDWGDFYQEVNKRCFRTKSLKRLRLESMLVEGMESWEDGLVVMGAVTLEMLARVEATEADVEDLAALLGQVEGAKVAATIRELAPGRCKLSLRTDPAVLDATRTCALLGGGGHRAAAGATLELPLEETKAAVRQAIRQVLAEG